MVRRGSIFFAILFLSTATLRASDELKQHVYPISGAWAALEPNSSYATVGTCNWYREGLLRERAGIPLPGDLVVFEGQKRSVYGGYFDEAGDVSTNLAAKIIGTNHYEITERFYQSSEGGKQAGWKRRTYPLKVLDSRTIQIGRAKYVACAETESSKSIATADPSKRAQNVAKTEPSDSLLAERRAKEKELEQLAAEKEKEAARLAAEREKEAARVAEEQKKEASRLASAKEEEEKNKNRTKIRG